MATTVLRDKQGRNQSVDFDLFFELRDLCFPTYKYKQGNCHNIVHYCSMILTRRGIKHKKIWCYAPARFVKYARESISKPDPNTHASMSNLLWGYHVALFFEEGPFSFIYDYVVDENMPILVDNWVAGMGLSKAKVEIVDAENYLFYKLKKKEPNLDFKYFQYEAHCKDDLWVPKGLAINETAMEFLSEERATLEGFSDLSYEYKTLVGNVLNFETVIKDQSFNKIVTPDFQAKHIDIIEKYRNSYFQNLNKWVDKVECLDA